MLQRNPLVGFVFGLIGPLLGLIIMKFAWFPNDAWGEYISMLTHTKDSMFKVCSLSLLVNLLPFVYFNSKRLDYLARGVFIATMLYVVFIVLARYVW